LYRGINVNVTLLFGLEAYWDTFQAYMRSLARRLDEGKALAPLTSVASFFLSRIDVAVDRLLRQRIDGEVNPRLRNHAEGLLGKTAVANAKLAYESLRAALASERWIRLQQAGARPQRILWASTGPKNAAYSDVMYIEPLIGPHTVSTMPGQTADAFDDHGRAAPTVQVGVDEARATMDGLERLGIDFGAVTIGLVNDGIQKFIEPYDNLLAHLAERGGDMRESPLST
jgi:transaldolase